MDKLENLRQMRLAMMDFAADAPDGKAAKYPSLFEPWKKDTYYKEGDRREYSGTLYKCRQAHTSQEIYPPDKVPALWAPINVTNAGTLDDPISAARGMEYTYGLYYFDSEDKNIYLCKRTGETEGNTIILQFMPHELIGQYFEAVNA